MRDLKGELVGYPPPYKPSKQQISRENISSHHLTADQLPTRHSVQVLLLQLARSTRSELHRSRCRLGGKKTETHKLRRPHFPRASRSLTRYEDLLEPPALIRTTGRTSWGCALLSPPASASPWSRLHQQSAPTCRRSTQASTQRFQRLPYATWPAFPSHLLLSDTGLLYQPRLDGDASFPSAPFIQDNSGSGLDQIGPCSPLGIGARRVHHVAHDRPPPMA